MRRFALILAVFLMAAVRLCHLDVVWTEEAYPLAAARAMLAGRTLYRDIWFDKPPLFPGFYMLFGAVAGWPLRLAGMCFVAFAAWAAWRAAEQLWPENEASRGWAALLTAFFLTFDFPATAIALTPDVLAVPFHLLAVGAIAASSPFTAGLFCGIALGFNSKALLILAVCLLWSLYSPDIRRSHLAAWRAPLLLLAGFAVPVCLLGGWLATQGSLVAHWQQVWVWGAEYSRDTPFVHPLAEGLRRTGGWLGFHAALAAAAICALIHERSNRWKFLLWIGVSLAGAWLGWRFFPRYFFLLLPALVIPAARGFALAPLRWKAAFAGLLLIPFVRFMPASAQLGVELLEHRPHTNRDLALIADSQRAASLAASLERPGDTALVWGYRPELFVFSGLLPGTEYLDSQPLNGVIADRHLTSSRPTFPDLARANREAVLRLEPPEWIFDGLGPLNPRLSVFDQATGLAAWRGRYEEIGRTQTVVVYRKIP